MKKILVTGFDPFNGSKINPSFEAVKILPPTIGEYEIVKLEVKTIFNFSAHQVIDAIKSLKPSFVLMVGEAGERDKISIERIGINLDDARIKDNGGAQPLKQVIDRGGADGIFSNIPIYDIYEAIRAIPLAVEISNSAGTFVCNHLLYSVLNFLTTSASFKIIKAGFIHVPLLPEDAKKYNLKGMRKEEIAQALLVAIKTMIK
jgi:pyroglutamyl-peptidase